jgi:hypothetical protein
MTRSALSLYASGRKHTDTAAVSTSRLQHAAEKKNDNRAMIDAPDQRAKSPSEPTNHPSHLPASSESMFTPIHFF